MAESQEKGNAFEEEVAYLYRTLGYEVKRNVSIQGHQIDIIVEINLPGGVSTKIAVECKYKESGFLTKNSVMENINSLKDIRSTNEVQNIIIITTNGFSKDLWSTAKANNINLLTIDDLQMEIINIHPYIDRLIHDFENFEEYNDGQRKPIIDLLQRANLYKYYVNLRCEDSNKNIFDPIDEYIEEWLTMENKNHITILGDYGTGKSSFLLYLAYALAKSFKENPFSVPVPFFISLKKYKYIRDIKEQILEILRNDYSVIIPSPLYFQRLLEDGKLILLLDGFDEMESKSNKDIILKNFEEITRLVTMNSKIILTSRTHYFKTHSQVKDIFNPEYDTDLLKMVRDDYRFELLELLEFNNDQIIEFLSRHTDDYISLWEKIKSTYNLEDLSKRPILLEMIVRSLPTIMKAGKAINSSELYGIYTDIWIKRDDWRSIMKPEEKAIFMEELALFMFMNDIQEVHYSRLTKIVLDHFKRKINSKEEEDIFDTDTRTCSFLNRDYEGNYKFIHRSFMEFFVSKQFYREILTSNTNFFKQKLLTPEILDFLGKMNLDKNKLYDIIYLTCNRTFDETKYMGGNAISILNYMGETFNNKDFSNTILRGANFENCVCDNSSFSHAELQNSNFIDASLLYANFEGANLEGSLIEDIGYITYVSLNGNEQTLAFGTAAGYVFIVDLNTFKKSNVIRETNNAIIKIKFFNNDSLIGFLDSKNNIFIHKTTSLTHCDFKLLGDTICAADFDVLSPEVIISDRQGRVRVINLDSRSEYILGTININEQIFNNLVLSKNGEIISIDNDANVVIYDFKSVKQLKLIKVGLDHINDIYYSPYNNLIYIRQITEIPIKIKSTYGEEPKREVYTYNMDYELINFGTGTSKIIKAGTMGVISGKSNLMFTIDSISSEHYSNELFAKFKIINMETSEALKESYDISLMMAPEYTNSKDYIHYNYLPHTVFSTNSIYISDFSGRLMLWDWEKEPTLDEKQKHNRGCGRSSITMTMLKSKFIHENIFKCNNMNLTNVIGLNEEQLCALKRIGAIIS